MSHTNTATEYLSVREAAALLRIDTSRLYRLVRAGTVPATRIGRTVRISASQLDAWAAAGGAA